MCCLPRQCAVQLIEFRIGPELLAMTGTSAGSALTSTVIKTNQNATERAGIVASDETDPPRLSQVILAEKASAAGETIDVTEFQNFWLTLIPVVAYVAMSIVDLRHTASPE
jgi:hypothetical protein